MRFRFAPSPTGNLHLGNVRTAILAWLHARSSGGQFILRIEDLDSGRVRPEFRLTQVEDLKWLGIDWDEGPGSGGPFGPYLQSLRQERYESALARLRDLGRIYDCRCSRKEIAAASSAPHADEYGPPYPGTCRDSPSQRATPSALRFRVSPGPVCFEDQVYGRQCFDPAVEVGDFVVRRRDGAAAYQLAVVVDDAEMGITDVLRGADLLSSTARQILLYEALGLAPPRWAHVPLLREEYGDRLSKRQGSLTVQELRFRGVPAERIVGWLAFTCGLQGDDRATTIRDLLALFDLSKLPRQDTPVSLPAWLTSGTPAGS